MAKRGEEVVKMNYAAVDKGTEVHKIEIPAEWAAIKVEKAKDGRDIPAFIRDIMEPINAMKGDDLPVSAFAGREDGTFPSGTSAYEKRGIAVNVPEWQPNECIQCKSVFICLSSRINPSFPLN